MNASDVVIWWEANRPTHRATWFVVDGPIGEALMEGLNFTVVVPEHVKEARTQLGLPRINPDQGEAP